MCAGPDKMEAFRGYFNSAKGLDTEHATTKVGLYTSVRYTGVHSREMVTSPQVADTGNVSIVPLD